MASNFVLRAHGDREETRRSRCISEICVISDFVLSVNLSTGATLHQPGAPQQSSAPQNDALVSMAVLPLSCVSSSFVRFLLLLG